MILFFILAIAAGLLGLLMFHTSVLLSILAIVCCAGGLVYSLIGRSRKKLISTGLLLVGLALCIMAGERTDLIHGYQKDLDRIQDAIEAGEPDKALEKIDALETTYAVTDATLFARAQLYTTLHETDNALATLDQIQNQTQERWYRMREQALLDQAAENMETQLDALYLEAAAKGVESPYLMTMAGHTCLQQNDPKLALTYLIQAFRMDPDSGTTCYYAGVAHFHLGSYEIAMEWFDLAEEKGLSEKLSENLKWYREQIAKGVQNDA